MDRADEEDGVRPGPARRRPAGYRALLPPLALIGAALAVLAYRVNAPDWRGVWRLAERRPVAPRRVEPPVEVAEVPRPAVQLRPVEAASRPGPAPTPAPDVTPPPPPAPKNADAARAALVDRGRAPEPEPGPAPKRVPPAVAEVPAGPEATERAQVEIEREVHRRRVEREALADVKRRATDDARDEARRMIAEGRARFLADVRRLIEARGDAAGPAIGTLIRAYNGPGRYVPRPTERELRLARGAGRRTRTRARVEYLRALGVAEPAILADLFQAEKLRIHARNGPRNAGEALAFAARVLLEVPLPDPGGRARP